MKKFKKILMAILIVVVIGAVLGVSYYFYETMNYFTTENAQVSANMITITPEVTGKLVAWNISEGDNVKVGQLLGRQDTTMLTSTSAINAQTLANNADSIISKTDIKSPIAGKIILTQVIKGQVVSPGMELATVADTDNVYIKANIEETNIFKIHAGQKVNITIDAYPGKHFIGNVQNIGQATESVFSSFPSLSTSGTFSKTTQLIPVKISIDHDPQLVLMPGMNVTVKIHIK